MNGLHKATNYKIKYNRGDPEYWLSFDNGKSWGMVSKDEFYTGEVMT
jgi:hypothetical protein